MDYFLSPKQGLREGEEEEGEEEEERGQIKPRYGFLYGYMTLVWNYKDFGMLFVHELLGYEA